MAGHSGEWSTLVLRVWFEDPPAGFRARIMTHDAAGTPVTAVFTQRDRLLEALGRWIDERRE